MATVAYAVDQAVSGVSSLIIIPFALVILGKATFGAWVALLAIVGFFGMADFGLTSAVVNPLARAFGARDRAAARRMTASCFAALLVIGMVVGAICTLLIADGVIPLGQVLGLHHTASADVRTACIVALDLTIGGYVVQLSDVILNASQRGHVGAWADVAGQISSLAGVLALAADGSHSMTAFALVIVGPTVAQRALLLAYLVASNASVSVAPRLASLRTLKELFTSSVTFFVMGCSELLYTQAPPLAIAWTVGAVQVPTYSVPFQLFFGTYVLIGTFNRPLWPAVAEAWGNSDRDWIRSSYRSALRRTALACAIFVPLLFLVRPFVHLWTGGRITVPWAVAIFFFFHFIQWSINYSQVIFVTGLGFIRQRAATVSTMGIMTVIVLALVVPRFGAAGAAGATLIAMLLAQTFVLPRILRLRAPWMFTDRLPRSASVAP